MTADIRYCNFPVLLGVIFALSIIAGASRAAEPPPEVKRFFEASAAARKEFITNHTSQIQQLDRHLADARKNRRPADTLAAQKQALTKELSLLKVGKGWPLAPSKRVYEVDGFRSDAIEVVVEQVIDAENFIGARRRVDAPDLILWFKGFDTSKLVDGKTFTPGDGSGMVIMRGTHKHFGSTLLEVTRFDLDEIRPFLKAGEVLIPYGKVK